MRVDPESVIQEVRGLYLENPCKLTSIAFWKTEQQIRESKACRLTEDGSTTLYAIKGGQMWFYWSDDRTDSFHMPLPELRELDFIVLHEDYFRLIEHELTGYEVSLCNPLLYDFSFDLPDGGNEDYYSADFDFQDERHYLEAANLINSAYEGFNHSSEGVKGWTKLPAFDPTLWVWVREKGTDEPAALGITTYQESIKEAYLDWIQASPKHHGKGVGRMLVYETLRRAIPKSDIIRVTGRADEFYKRCGFVETEKWYYAVRD